MDACYVITTRTGNISVKKVEQSYDFFCSRFTTAIMFPKNLKEKLSFLQFSTQDEWPQGQQCLSLISKKVCHYLTPLVDIGYAKKDTSTSFSQQLYKPCNFIFFPGIKWKVCFNISGKCLRQTSINKEPSHLNSPITPSISNT